MTKPRSSASVPVAWGIADFTSASAAGTLAEACAAVGLDAGGATLLRFGENALFRLRAPVVVRVARHAGLLASVRKEVAVARWLTAAGVPAVRPVEGIEQPLVVGERVVSFWEFIDSVPPKPTVVDLADILRRIHALEVPPDLDLPAFRVLGGARRRIELLPGITEDDRVWLRARGDELEAQYHTLEFPFPPSAVHGDGHVGNLLRHPSGEVRILDLENFCVGPREWDLAIPASEYRQFGWYSEQDYREFVRVYGFEVLDWPGFEVLRAIHEFRMTTWLMQNVNERPEIAAEAQRRFAAIHDDTVSRRDWRPF
jgi:aminoglycoside phosphotransferase (APT) family kinase protein